MTHLENEINKILAKWNPIGVPLSIAEIEYSSYIIKIIDVYKKHKSVYSYLIYLYTEVMGYDLNKESEKATKAVSDEIIRLLGMELPL